MLIGLCTLLLYLRWRQEPLDWDRQHRPAYLISGLSVFLAMTIVYWSARYIPSGWIALLFALSPFMTGIFSWYLRTGTAPGPFAIVALLIAFAGLSVIFFEGLALGQQAWMGILGIIVSTAIHSLAAVLLNRRGRRTPAVATTAGGLVIATPLFILLTLWLGDWPAGDTIDSRTMAAIVYLGICASAIGFPLYFFILQHLSSTTVSLLTLITPVTALLLGQQFNDETIAPRIWTGALMILAGLALYACAQQHAKTRKNRSLWPARD